MKPAIFLFASVIALSTVAMAETAQIDGKPVIAYSETYITAEANRYCIFRGATSSEFFSTVKKDFEGAAIRMTEWGGPWEGIYAWLLHLGKGQYVFFDEIKCK